MIRLNDIVVSFEQKNVLNHLSLTIPDDGIVWIFGSSGIGKTTLLRVIAGLQRVDSGYIEGLQGRTRSFAFQEPRLLEWRTALENVAVVANDSIAKRLLASMDMLSEKDTLVKNLSGGQKQRISLARAFAFSDDIVLLDEPFTGLDENNRRRVAALIGSARLCLMASHESPEEYGLAITKKIVL